MHVCACCEHTFGSVVLVGLTQLCSVFRSCLSQFCVDSHLRVAKNRVYPCTRRNRTIFFNISPRRVNPIPRITRTPCIQKLIISTTLNPL